MRRALAAFAVCFAACGELKSAPGVDAGTTTDAGEVGPDTHEAGAGDDDDGGFPEPTKDAGPILPPDPDAGVGPEKPCEPQTVACFDPTLDDVIEVPSEAATIEAAVAVAKPFNTIQIRSIGVASSFKLPAGVSLHGCEGAGLSGDVTFTAGASAVDGFTVGGRIFVNAAASVTVSKCTFVSSVSAPTAAALSISSVTPAASAVEPSLDVRGCWFRNRPVAIQVTATANAGPLGVSVAVRNCLFDSDQSPISITRVDGSPKVSVNIASSTFYDFKTAIALKGLATGIATVDISASLFVHGVTGIDASDGSAYHLGYSFGHDMITPTAPPIAAGLVDVDPEFVAASQHDLRLSRGSLAVDRIPSILKVPPTDFYGCKRPAGSGTDPGAFESQAAR